MDPIFFEEYSYEENELELTGIYTVCAVTLAMEKPLGRRRYFIGRWYHRNK